MVNKTISTFLAMLLAAVFQPSQSAQVKETRDGVAVEAIISTREPTRIRVDRSRIIDVIGNVYSSNNCAPKRGDPAAAGTNPSSPAVNPGGEFVLSCDLGKGEIYIRPVGTSAKPINIFVSTDKATYTLILRRAEVPADTVVLSDRSISNNASANGAAARPGSAGRSSSYVRSIKTMLAAMVSDQVPVDIRVEDVNVPRQLWSEASFLLTKVFEGRGLIGEQYLLTNISNAAMVLAEQEFDREDGNVLAVSIDNLNLRPNDSTVVHVIRSGEQQ